MLIDMTIDDPHRPPPVTPEPSTGVSKYSEQGGCQLSQMSEQGRLPNEKSKSQKLSQLNAAGAT